MDNNNQPAPLSVLLSAAGSVRNDSHNASDAAGNPAQPFISHSPAADSHSQAQEQDLADIIMADNDFSDMPGLQDVSDSSDEDSDSDRDANEVEMQAVDDDDEDDDAIPVLTFPVRSLGDLMTDMNPPSTSTLSAANLARTASPRGISNRRARVDDDEDEERDRRHPSQRIQSSSNTPTSRSVTSTPLPQNQPDPSSGTLPRIQVHQIPFQPVVPGFFGIGIPADVAQAATGNAFNFLSQFASNGNINPEATPTATPADDNTNNNPAQGPSTRTFTHQTDDGFMTVEVSTGPIAFGMPFPHPPAQPAQGGAPPPTAQQPPQLTPQPNPPHGPPVNLTDLLTRLGTLGATLGAAQGPGGAMNLDFGGFGLPLGLFGDLQEKEDPERARRLVDGLEEAPVGLIRRLERVGGSGGGMGEDDGRGGDGMCAICWDRLLDAEGEGFGKEKKEDVALEAEASSAEASTSEEKAEDVAEKNQPKIVSLPCAHVFHADCLIPWFSRPRHTTCPTCRFNIDPHDLTYISAARRRQIEREQARRARAAPAGDAEANASDDNDITTNPATPTAPPADGEPLPPPVNPFGFNAGGGNPNLHVRRTNHGLIISSDDQGLDELVEQVNNQGPFHPPPPVGEQQTPAQAQPQPQPQQDDAPPPPPPPPGHGAQAQLAGGLQAFLDGLAQRLNRSIAAGLTNAPPTPAAAAPAQQPQPQQPQFQQPQYTIPVAGPGWPFSAQAGVQAGAPNTNVAADAGQAQARPQGQPPPPPGHAQGPGATPGAGLAGGYIRLSPHVLRQSVDGRPRVSAVLPPPPSVPSSLYLPALPLLPSLPVPINVGLRTTPITHDINFGGVPYRVVVDPPIVIRGGGVGVPPANDGTPATEQQPPLTPPTPATQAPPNANRAAAVDADANPQPPAGVRLPDGGTEILRLTFDMVINPVMLNATPNQANQAEGQAPGEQHPVQAPSQPQSQTGTQQPPPQQPLTGAEALDYVVQNFMREEMELELEDEDEDEDEDEEDVMMMGGFDLAVVESFNRRAREQAESMRDSVELIRAGRPPPPPFPALSIEDFLGGPLAGVPGGEDEEGQGQSQTPAQPTSEQQQQEENNPQPRTASDGGATGTDSMLQIMAGFGSPLGDGFHIASGSGRTVGEAFQQIFAGMGANAQQRPAQAQPQPQPQQGPAPTVAPDAAPASATGAQPQFQQQQPRGAGGLEDLFGMFAAPPRQGPGPAPAGPGGATGTQPQAQDQAQQQEMEEFVRRLFAQPPHRPQAPVPGPPTAAVPGATPPGQPTNQPRSFEDFVRLFGAPPLTQTQNGQPGGMPGFRFVDLFSGMRPGPAPTRPKGPWVLPAPPGLTLRQRIERREREAGLRCHDVSCGLGPSDEDPFGADLGDAAVLRGMKQLSVHAKGESGRGAEGERVCEHLFHSGCLVSAERVALKGSDAIIDEDGTVEVSCPVCRHVGCVTKEEWDEGVRALTLA